MQKLPFSDPPLQLITQFMDGPLRYANFLLHFPKSCKMTVTRILVVDQASILWEILVVKDIKLNSFGKNTRSKYQKVNK